MDYRYYETIDSTNSEAKRIVAAENLSSPLLLIAGSQTAGRGRQGKSFYSPSDTGLYMTLAVPMNCPISSQVTLTTRVAVAVARALEEPGAVTAGETITPQIKWVNDIYVNGLKACGILCEAVNDYDAGLLKWAIIGVGINISTDAWPQELKGIAGSIATGPVDKRALAMSVSQGVLKELENLSDLSYLEYYREHSNVIGEDITFFENGSAIRAHALDIDETGGLIVRLSGGEDAGSVKVLNSGEISVRIAENRAK